MFTGIVEALGHVEAIVPEGENKHFKVKAPFTSELQIDQSVAHNGVCLTVVEMDDTSYTVTAIKETLDKSNLGEVVIADLFNLERCMKLGDRLDGHIVQGHVDQTATCVDIREADGSWYYTFEYQPAKDAAAGYITVEKGSVTVNGVSLTVVDSGENRFSVAIIPFTHEHTNFHRLQVGSTVNLEFDIIGKYVSKMVRVNQEQ